MKRVITSAVVLSGITAMAAQVIFTRELFVAFSGNELSIGFILAGWLLAGAAGSSLLGRLADRITPKVTVFSLCQLALAVLAPLTVILIRSARNMLNIAAGEIMPLFPSASASLIALAPFCVILGFMFALACRIYRMETDCPSVKIGRVYVLEAVGAMAGGFAASFFLIRWLDSVRISALLGLLNIVSGTALLYLSRDAKGLKPVLLAIAGIMLAINAAMWPLGGWRAINRYSLERQWQGYGYIDSADSIYGNIMVGRNDAQVSFFDNGFLLYAVPDRQSQEEAAHFALLEHPEPGRVLLIGGGAGGLLREIIKHPVDKVDYIELDPMIIKMARRYLPRQYNASLDDARVSVKNADGRFFVKTSSEKYDCVIIHLGDPSTAQINRYYTAEFFNEVKAVLKKGGVVSLALTSSEDYINQALADLLSSIHATLGSVFEDVVVMPGNTAHFLASDETELLTYDYHVMMQRAAARNLDVEYVREYYLFARLSPERISYIEDAVRRGRRAINHDFRPVSYYYSMIFWTSHFKDSVLGRLLHIAAGWRIWAVVLSACAAIIILGYVLARCGGPFRAGALTAVMFTGFSGMAFQIIVLMAFQVIYGYLFYKLGLILTSFMIGLALGGRAVTAVMPGVKHDRRVFILIQAAVCAYPLILPAVFTFLAGSKSAFVSWMGANTLFIILPVMAGFIGGAQFPIANKIYLGDSKDVGRTAGLNYGIDLLGSCLGALVTATFLIPLLGMSDTCLAIAAVNFSVLAALVILRKAH